MSALLNKCVSCHNAQGLLILALSRLTNGLCTTANVYSTHAVVADAIAFIAIVVADVPLEGWVYPFIFYIQVVS